MPCTVNELYDRIDRLPRVSLASLPTPLDDCPRLSTALGVPVSIKRDDLTGLALGGNKTRQLEFILARALSLGSDTLVTMAAVQSNQCRQTAAAARRLGLAVHLVLRGEVPPVPDGNLLLDRLLGAETLFLAPGATREEVNSAVAQRAAELKSSGCRPYVVDLMNDDSEDQALAAVSYALMVAELSAQMVAAVGPPEWIYLSSGSGGSATLAGTWLGCRALGWPTRVVGVSAAHTPDSVREDTLGIARRAAELLGLASDAVNRPETMIVERDYVGEGYGIATPEGLEAMRLAGRTEGLVLDPWYTAKVLAALINHVRRGRLEHSARVVFVHTGGTPLTFLHSLGGLIAGGE